MKQGLSRSMQRVWLIIRLRRLGPGGGEGQRGFSVLEVLLASTVFAVLVTGIIGAFVYGRASNADAGNHQRAMMLAEEGLEGVRNVRDASFTNLTDNTFGLAESGGVWTLSGTSDTTDIFTRTVAITAVDTNRKEVVVTVSWGSQSVSVTGRLSNWMAALPIVQGPTMMVYSKTTTTPFYRTWDGAAWGAEGSASAVTGNINYVVVKSSRTRNEAVMGVQTSTGAIFFQVWNGTSWGSATQVGTGPTGTRSFDIDYERSNDRAVIAFTPSSGSADFSYRTWDGATLSAATAVTTSPTTGAVNWIEVANNPLSASNEISLILMDANADIYGMAWNGTTWGTMGTATAWDTTASTAVTKKGIDVEYEQTSGEALFIWGDSVSTDQYYRTWNGTTLSAATLLDIAAAGGISEWVQLASRPSSNEIMYGVQDAGADLNTRKWSGTAWDTATQHAEHSATTENITSRNFDIAWETHASNPGKAWLVWGNSATVTAKQWSGTAWGTGTVIASSDDTSFVRLRADPASGNVFAGLYEDSTSATDDIWETRLSGGGTAWSAKNIIWGGATSATPVYFRVDITSP
jgi:prepilin-type N-terminal cleavage/methylation domain-containing protein